jgi:hypothetical protein
MPAPLSDPLGRRGCSRSASSTDCEYTSVGLACEKPRLASVSNASRRGIVRASITKPEGIQPWDCPQLPPAILHCAAPVSPLESRWYTPAPITPRRTCGRRRIDRTRHRRRPYLRCPASGRLLPHMPTIPASPAPSPGCRRSFSVPQLRWSRGYRSMCRVWIGCRMPSERSVIWSGA